MKIMGWEESVTFMAVVAVVSTLLRFIPALAPEVCDAVCFFFFCWEFLNVYDKQLYSIHILGSALV